MVKQIYSDLRAFGTRVGNTMEIQNAMYNLGTPQQIIEAYQSEELKDCNFDLKTANGVVAWYESADGNNTDIEKLLPIYSRNKNVPTDEIKIPLFTSNYGQYIYPEKATGMNQLTSVAKKLINDKDTRQAQLIINRDVVMHVDQITDKICTNYLLFRIVDNKLNMFVSMRSSDVLGLLPYDLFFFSHIMNSLHAYVVQVHKGLKIGEVTYFANSMHYFIDKQDVMDSMQLC